MAAPVISAALWNNTTHVLTVLWDQATTYIGAAYDVQLTTPDGYLYANTGAPSSGDGTATHVYALSAYAAGTPGDDNTLDVAASTVQNGAAAGNDVVEDSTPSIAIDHPIPINRTDAAALNTAFEQILGDGDTSAYNALQVGDITDLLSRLLGTSGLLTAAPLALTQARAAVTAYTKFEQSSKDEFAQAQLRSAMKELARTLPQDPATFAITVSGT